MNSTTNATNSSNSTNASTNASTNSTNASTNSSNSTNASTNASNNSTNASANNSTMKNNQAGGGMKTVGTKAQVYHGTAKRTSGGLTKKSLMKTKKGRIVSRKKHAAGKKALRRLVKAGFKAKKGSFKLFRK
jgi:hypothetical protein